MSITVFRNAAQIVSATPGAAPKVGAAQSQLQSYEGAALCVEHGRIVWLGPEAELAPFLRRHQEQLQNSPASSKASPKASVQEIDARNKVIIPGFVDPHTHVVWAGDRRDEMQMRIAGADYEAIFAAGGGILSSVRQTRATGEEELFQQSLRRVQRMRAMGTTALEIKSGYGLDLETEMMQLRVAGRLRDQGFRIRRTCLAAHAIPESHRGDEGKRAEFIDLICEEILPQVAAQKLAEDCDVFCDRGAITPDESLRILKRGQELGLRPCVHANELGHTGGAEVAAQIGARSADHLLYLNDAERQVLAKSKVIATLLPGTSLVLGKHYADGAALIEGGVAVALATDCNPGSCPMENMALALALACHGCKLSPAQALVAATHNAAAVLGMSDHLGRLEAGLSADLLLLDCDDYRDLVYHLGSTLVDSVWVGGEAVAGRHHPG